MIIAAQCHQCSRWSEMSDFCRE